MEDHGAFAAAFADVTEGAGELPEHLQQRFDEIVTADAETELLNRIEAEDRQIREEGWASRPIPVLRNYGNLSQFNRQQMVNRIGEIIDATPAPVTNGGKAIGPCCITGGWWCTLLMELVHRRTVRANDMC